MFTCIKCEFKYNALTGDADENMCNDCIYQTYCEHNNEEYQPGEPENNVSEGVVCADCGADLPIPEPDYGV
jgi:rubredoxin|tara:strand:+ start:313 stop:525 length:213 start_codon:yes stop_codon:yes gene_type:complete